MIVDAEQVIVYVLSNSLDAIAKKHSTIVTAVKPSVAQEIFNDYVKLISNAKDKIDIDTIFNTKTAALGVVKPTAITPENTQNTESPSSGITDNTTEFLPYTVADNSNGTYTKDDFIRDFSGQALEIALNKLAYMTYDEMRACVNYVLNLNKTAEIDRLQTLLLKVKSTPAPKINPELGIYIYNLFQMVTQPFDFAGNLVEYAEDAISWSFRYRPATTYALNNAIKILWALSPAKYISFLEELIEEYVKNNPHAAKATFSQEALLIYAMVTHIIKSISSVNETVCNMQFMVLAPG